jgi:hypothetical protein
MNLQAWCLTNNLRHKHQIKVPGVRMAGCEHNEEIRYFHWTQEKNEAQAQLKERKI